MRVCNRRGKEERIDVRDILEIKIIGLDIYKVWFLVLLIIGMMVCKMV